MRIVIGSRESIDTAKAVMHMVQGKATEVDDALLSRSNGAVTVLSAIEGNSAAWESVKKAAGTELREQNSPSSVSEADTFSTGEKAFEGARYKIAYTTENEPVAVIEDNILDGVDKSEWAKTAKEAIKKFRPEIPISGRFVKVNKITGSEYTNSKYTNHIRKTDEAKYRDKLTAAGNLDEIVIASTRYVNEGLNHSRKDNFSDFARGNVLLQVGDRKYSAEVIIGIKPNDDTVLYDIVNINDKNFDVKKKMNPNPDTSENRVTRREDSPSTNRVPQKEESVNTNSMQNSEVYSGGVKVTIPEGSRIVKNIVLDDESAAFRKSNPKGYKVIETMAQDLGMRVKHVKGLTDSDGKVLDGIITSEGIFINTESKNPTRFAATHEFSHRMKQASPEIWQRYQDFVIDKLKIDGRYYKVFELKAAAYGSNNEAYINEEIAADYIGELFGNVNELADFIRESRRNAVTVRDVWYGILDKLGLLDEKKKAQRMWRDAYKKAMDNVEDGKVGEYSGENASRRVDKKKRTPYNEYYTNALKWARATDRRPGDVTTISVDYYTSALIEATADGFVELAKGSYKEVKAEYERVYSEKDKSFHAYTEEIRSERDPNMWNMLFAEDGEYAPGNGEQIRDTEFQDDTTGNNEYLRSGNKRKSVSGTRLSDADSSVIDATPQSAVPTAPLAGEPSDAEGGFIKPGAEPRRDVKVPKSVEEGAQSGNQITVNMDEHERAEILKKASLNVVEAKSDALKLSLEEVAVLESRCKSKAEVILKKLGKKFGVFKNFYNKDIDLEFNYSKSSLNESSHKQSERNPTYSDFATMLTIFDSVVSASQPIEIHTDKYAGTKREDTNLKQNYVLISAFKNGEFIVPVEINIKEFKNNQENKLHMSVTLKKIRADILAPATNQDSYQSTPSTLNISIAELIKNVNPSDSDFLRYIPDEMLNEEQIKFKNEALEKDRKKIEGLKKSVSGTRLSDADSSVIDATPQSAVPTAPLQGEPSDAEGGFIKPGAEPRRDVKVPKSVEKGTKVRQFARTAAEAETLTDETAEEAAKQVIQENIVQIAKAGGMGALAGGIMGGGAVAAANVTHNRYMTRVGERILENPGARNRVLRIGIENNSAEANRVAGMMADGRRIDSKTAGKMVESVLSDSLSKDGGLVNIISTIAAVEGRSASYIGSRESIDTAKAVMHMVQGKATEVDDALLSRSNGAVTVLSAIEGNSAAWESVKKAAGTELREQNSVSTADVGSGTDKSLPYEGARYMYDEGIEVNVNNNPDLTDADLNEYMQTGKKLHTRNKKQRMAEAGKKPILTSAIEVKNFISDVIRGKAQGEVRAFKKVGKRLAAAILEKRSTLDTLGKYLELNADDLRESYKRHSSPKEKGDIPLSEQDFERIPEYIDEFDGVLSVNTYNNKVEVHLYKETEDGYVKILTVASNERNSLQVTKLIGVSKEKFEEKYAKKIEGRIGSPKSKNKNSNPSTTARHTADAPSINRVPQNEESVNTNSMQNSEVYSGGVKVTIPEGSRIVKNIVLDDESAAFRKSNPKGYKVIETMAQDLGMRVKYVKGLTDSDGKVLDGIITSEGIFINTESKNPTRFAATHEFSHRMKQASPEIWQRYQDFVIDKLKIDGRYYKVFELKAAAYGNNNEAYINEEIAADYIGELFGNVNELADFIRESRRNAVTVRDVWYGILDKLGLLDEKKKVQRMWRDAYRAAMKNKDGEFEGEAKYSIQRIVGQNKDYGIGVYLDSDTLTGLTEKERIDAVKEYVKKIGGKDFVAYDQNGKPARIRIAKHSWKYVKENGSKIRVNKDLTSYLDNTVKQEAIVLIDELIATAKQDYSEPSRYSHGWLDNYGENDWDYWRVFIQEKNKTVWEATLNVANSANGEKILYDIYPIEMVEGAVTSATTTTNNTVSQNPPSVKQKKSVAGTRLSDADYSATDTTPQSAEPTAPLTGEPSDAAGGFIPPGAEPRRDVKVPKSVEKGTKVRQLGTVGTCIFCQLFSGGFVKPQEYE